MAGKHPGDEITVRDLAANPIRFWMVNWLAPCVRATRR
jgi:FMN-dependent NADH-azoreductase